MKALLGVPSIDFYAPPADPDDPNADVTGITAWLFPEWFVAQYEERNTATGARSRPLVSRMDLVKGSYERDRKKYRVVPVRFVQACLRGHVSDIGWQVFVHSNEDKCRRALWMEERGTSGDLTDITSGANVANPKRCQPPRSSTTYPSATATVRGRGLETLPESDAAAVAPAQRFR